MNTEASVRLRQRREIVEMTLLYVEHEQREFETGAAYRAEAAYRQRAWLLEQLTAWYRAELRDLDRAIKDMTKGEARNKTIECER